MHDDLDLHQLSGLLTAAASNVLAAADALNAGRRLPDVSVPGQTTVLTAALRELANAGLPVAAALRGAVDTERLAVLLPQLMRWHLLAEHALTLATEAILDGVA